MRKITLALSAACLLFSLNSAVVARASAPTPLYTGTTAAILAEQAPIHWVSVAQIENSLVGRPPMAVGFDIDDTVLFSSPGFWRGKNVFARQRSVSEEPGVLGKNEQRLGRIQHPKRGGPRADRHAREARRQHLLCHRTEPDQNGNRFKDAAG